MTPPSSRNFMPVADIRNVYPQFFTQFRGDATAEFPKLVESKLGFRQREGRNRQHHTNKRLTHESPVFEAGMPRGTTGPLLPFNVVAAVIEGRAVPTETGVQKLADDFGLSRNHDNYEEFTAAGRAYLEAVRARAEKKIPESQLSASPASQDSRTPENVFGEMIQSLRKKRYYLDMEGRKYIVRVAESKEAIKHIRFAKPYTRENFAYDLGKSSTFVYELEAGRYVPSETELQFIADILRLNESEYARLVATYEQIPAVGGQEKQGHAQWGNEDVAEAIKRVLRELTQRTESPASKPSYPMLVEAMNELCRLRGYTEMHNLIVQNPYLKKTLSLDTVKLSTYSTHFTRMAPLLGLDEEDRARLLHAVVKLNPDVKIDMNLPELPPTPPSEPGEKSRKPHGEKRGFSL